MAFQDILTVVVIFLVASVVLLFSYYVFNAFITHEDLNAEAAEVGLNLTTKVQEPINATLQLFDSVLAIVLIGLFLVTAILAWLVPSHPIFFIGLLLFYTMAIPFVTIVANIYGAFTTGTQLSITANNFPTLHLIYSNFALLVAAHFIICGLAMFGKPPGARVEGGGPR
jgi:hypothetical protein